MAHHDNTPKVHGIMAQFATTDEVVQAAQRASANGYTVMDAYSPVPVHGLYEAMGYKRSILGWLVLCGGIFGFCFGLGLQFWVSAAEISPAMANLIPGDLQPYPVNVGGRPFWSWPAFIPVTFETTILFSALTAVIGMFALNGLPAPYHPVFNAENFELATVDRFFLCIEATDPLYHEAEVTDFFNRLNPENVCVVPV